MVTTAEQIRISIKAKPAAPKQRPGKFLSTGSTLLNLALADRPDGGFLPGHFYWLIGDSGSGKTFLSMTCFAEACRLKDFAKHELIYDNVEDGMLMDVVRLFGKEALRRIRPPGGSREKPKYSRTIEQFYYNIDNALATKKPFVYILDSHDALDSKEAQELFDKRKAAHERGNKEPGSYGDGKAKMNSQNLRRVVSKLPKTGSILVIVSQTRDNFDPNPFSSPKVTAGGKALRFYCTAEVWLAPVGTVKKKVLGKNRKVGQRVGISLKKNRTTGKLHYVQTAIFPSYGVDDISSCVDWLVEEGWWKKRKGKDGTSVYDAGALGKLGRSELIAKVEGGHDGELYSALQACWDKIASESTLGRKPRYV